MRTRLVVPRIVVILAAGLLTSRPAASETQAPVDTVRLTLGEAARLAAAGSPAARIAAARVRESEARARGSWAGLLPRASLALAENGRTLNTASFGLDFPAPAGGAPLFDPDGEVVGPIRTTDVRASIEIPVLDLASLDRHRSAERLAQASHADAREAAQDAAARAARRYVDVLRTRSELAARREDLALARELLGMARDQLEAGVGVALDVTRAEARVSTVQAEVLDAEAALERSRLALLRALGMPLDSPMDLVDALEALPTPEAPPDPDPVVRRSLESRPTIRASETRLEALGTATSAARAERLPTISVVADDGYYGKGPERLLNTYAWQAQVRVPVFTAFAVQARIDEAAARARTEAYRLEDAREEVAYQAREAVLSARAAVKQMEAARDRLRLARQEVNDAEERVRAGVSGNGDLVRASLNLSEARTAYVRALANVQLSRVDLAWVQGRATALDPATPTTEGTPTRRERADGTAH